MKKVELSRKIEHSGISISEIARRLKVTRATIYTWIDSEEKFNYDKILSVLPSNSDELEQLKQTNKILLEKISSLEEDEF
jgi:transposase